MVNFVFSPAWFYGIDAVFEAGTAVIAAIISLYSYKIYKFTKEKRYFWFSTAFVMLAFAFAAKIFTNVTSYFNIIERNSFGLADVAYNAAQGSDLFFIYGYAAYRALTLVAFLGIYLVMTNKVKTSKSAVFLFTYLVLALVYFSKLAALSFHLTAALILFFISMFTFRNCYQRTNAKTVCVSTAFFMLMLSQLIFIPAISNNIAYVLAEVIQLIGYSSMLMAYVLVRKSTK